MDAPGWTLFTTMALVTAFSPGPAVLMSLGNAATAGARRAVIGSLGNAAGVFAVAAAVTLGLGAVMQASAWTFAAIKLAGAVYLIHLGVRQFRRREPLAANGTTPRTTSPGRLFTQGFLVAATNPKSIVFFAALMPQFVRNDAPSAGHDFVLMTAVFAASTLLSHACYIALGRHAGRWLATPSRGRWLNRGLGTLLAACGIGMLRMRPAGA